MLLDERSAALWNLAGDWLELGDNGRLRAECCTTELNDLGTRFESVFDENY